MKSNGIRHIYLIISIFAFAFFEAGCNRSNIPCPSIEEGAKERTVEVEGGASITAYSVKKKNFGTLKKKQDKRLRNKRNPIRNK